MVETLSKGSFTLSEKVQTLFGDLQLASHWPAEIEKFDRLLVEENPFFSAGGEVQIFFDESSLLVGFHHPQNIFEGKKYSTFSLAIGDVSSHLKTLEKESQSRGAQELVGPLSFKTCFDYRLTTKPSRDVAFAGCPPENSGLSSLLKSNGFEVAASYITDRITDLPHLREKALTRLPRLLKGFKAVKSLEVTEESFGRYFQCLLPLSNEVFDENPYFLPLTPFDFQFLYGPSVGSYICKKTSRFLVDESEKLVGFSFNFPDQNKPDRLLVKTFGVHPSVREGGKSFVLLLNEIIENSTEYSEIAFCLMSADNQAHRLTKKHCHETIEHELFVKGL